MTTTEPITLSKVEARRFMLAYQALWPPRTLEGKAAIIDFFRRVGCIQFDPVNIVGRNPDLVLQARVKGYSPQMLEDLLYRERVLWDGWDKLQSIYLAEDWPFFARRRAQNRENHWFPHDAAVKFHPLILAAIRERGPICSLDLQQKDKIDGFWGFPIRVERAALENLYNMGELGIHHRVGTRRYFDLVEHLLPDTLLNAVDPNPDDESYQDWHVLRRLGAAGLAHPASTEYWPGITGVKARERRTALARLTDKGSIIPVAIEEIPKQIFYMRMQERDLLDMVRRETAVEKKAALIAPLDNLIWHRDLVRWLFDFDYTWEVYKPAEKRQYGHYVLPLLYGDRFIARCDLALDRKDQRLMVRHWWWEQGIKSDDDMVTAIADCLQAFCSYLDVKKIEFSDEVTANPFLNRVIQQIRNLDTEKE